jgi:hypothetical protein
MSYTWIQFKNAVSDRYNAGAKTTDREQRAIDAVGLFVKSYITREVYGDLPLAKSYEEDYLELKVMLAGYTITSNFATVKAGVLTRITKDGNRAAISAYTDLMIQRGIDDFNGTATTYESMLVEGAMEVQRHVPCMIPRTTTVLNSNNTVLVGEASQYSLPEGAQILTLKCADLVDDLAAVTAYVLDDEVVSNGRVYKTTTAGTTGASLGAGLVSLDPQTPETLGTAVFEFVRAEHYYSAYALPWRSNAALTSGKCQSTPSYSLSPEGATLLIFPNLIEEKALLEYRGIKYVFADNDQTPFYSTTAECVAQYIMGMMQKDVAGRPTDAQRSLAAHAALLRRMWLDCNAAGGSTIL